MNISFKIAQDSDVDTLVRFMRALFESDNPPPDSAFNEAKGRAAVANLLGLPAYGRVWLILANDIPVGYVVLTIGYSLEYHGRDAFVDEIYLEAPYRGQGIGGQAFALVEQTCKELGIQALHLEVERPNYGAQRLYKRLGFEEHDRYLMTKWLTNQTPETTS